LTRISLDQANAVIAAAFAKGRELALNPLSVAVMDAGGHLIAFQRQDGASTLRPQIACGKAGSALALGVSSRKISDMAGERPGFIASLGDDNGVPIGAVGITGDTSDSDEVCTFAGIAAVGLKSQE
jgi:uncharacterized protein GlcG (DUF336 family)